MKPSMAIKPLVFAIAAIMAVAAQAGQNDRRDRGHDNHHNDRPTVLTTEATAKALDKQSSTGNRILNEGTVNEAEMSSSATGASGNVGVNVAAGSGNQQDNAAAIANSQVSSLDNAFVFGNASAEAKVTQYSNNNRVDNYSTTASAVMSGSGGGSSGNVGVNIAGGDLNQQKNTMAIANASSPLGGNSSAIASADQNGPGLTVNNRADRTYSLDTITLTTTKSGSSSFNKDSSLSVDKSASSNWSEAGAAAWNASGSKTSNASGSASGESNSTSSATLDAALTANASASSSFTFNNGNGDRTRSQSSEGSLEANLNASLDTSHGHTYDSSFEKAYDSSYTKAGDSSYERSGESASASTKDITKSYSESSAFELSNSVSFQVLTPTGWANPVTNTATLSGSVNGGSGNLGVNVAAGVGNQQSNSLAISNTSF